MAGHIFHIVGQFWTKKWSIMVLGHNKTLNLQHSKIVLVYFIEYICFIVFLCAPKDINCTCFLLLVMFSPFRLEKYDFGPSSLMGCGWTHCFGWCVVRLKTLVPASGFSTGCPQKYFWGVAYTQLLLYFSEMCVMHYLSIVIENE
jgi:hypothetical protein